MVNFNYHSGSNKIRSAPYNFPYAGFIENGSLKYIGSFGYYWSRTTSSNTGTYDLFFYSSNVDPTDLNARYNGYSIRCVATT